MNTLSAFYWGLLWSSVVLILVSSCMSCRAGKWLYWSLCFGEENFTFLTKQNWAIASLSTPLHVVLQRKVSGQQVCAGKEQGCGNHSTLSLQVAAILMPLSIPVTQFPKEIRMLLGALWLQTSPARAKEVNVRSWETDGKVWTEAAPIQHRLLGPHNTCVLCHPHVCLWVWWDPGLQKEDQVTRTAFLLTCGQQNIASCLGVGRYCSNTWCWKLRWHC